MAGLTKRGGMWHFVWRDRDGIVRRKSSGHSDRAKAEKELQDFEDELRLDRKDPTRQYRKTSIEQHLNDYIAYLSASGTSEKHCGMVRQRIERVIAATKAKRPDDLKRTRVIAAIGTFRKSPRKKGDDGTTQQQLSAQSQNWYRAAARQFVRWLYEDKRISENLLAKMPMLNVKVDRRHDRRALTTDEFAALLTATRESDAVIEGLNGLERCDLYVTARLSGLRRMEIASLTPSHLQLEVPNPYLEIEARYSKHKDDDKLPIHPDLLPLLRRRSQGLQLGERLFPSIHRDTKTGKMMRADLKAAGVAYRDHQGRAADFHALRHTFISAAWASGAEAPVIMKLARHTSLGMTLNYSHTRQSAESAAMRAMPGLPPERGGQQSGQQDAVQGRLSVSSGDSRCPTERKGGSAKRHGKERSDDRA